MKKTFTKITAATLAILTLLFTFCLTSFASEKEGGADVYIGSGVTHFDDISEAFTAAVTSKKDTKLVLREDWVADENGSFGKGNCFPGGGIGIVSKFSDITIDLNGNKIDRGLTKETKDGYVFYIRNSSSVTIKDSSKAKTALITGGFNKGNGGAFYLEGAKLTLDNITVAGNTSSSRGGAFYAKALTLEDETVSTVLTLDECVVTENKAKTGGAIYSETSTSLEIFDTTITNNTAVADGGIHTEICGLFKSYITLGGKVVIADNNTEKDGKGLMLDENLFLKVVVEYDSSRPLEEGSRIVILSKTGDKTLRITADSDNSNIDCFEYENDSYKIIVKGTGAEQYLDIKKA